MAAVAVAGCGEQRIDVDETAKFAKSAVAKQIGSAVEKVDCPDKVAVKADDAFTCSVVGADGTRGDARFVQKDDEGNLAFSAPFLNTKAAERIVRRQLRKRSKKATVSCPQIVIVARNKRFRCRAKTGSETKTVFARQTDSKGNFTYRIG
ncbi:MAG: DUF4333 domain-containing protein [Solirubrobacteraceae bacterium]